MAFAQELEVKAGCLTLTSSKPCRFNYPLGLKIWTLIGSLNNAFDEVCNSDFVQGGFAHAAEPRVWKVDFRYNF